MHENEKNQLELTPEMMAQLLFNDFYRIIFIPKEGFWEERIATKQALNSTIRAVKLVISANPHSNPLNTEVHSTFEFWQDVLKALEAAAYKLM